MSENEKLTLGGVLWKKSRWFFSFRLQGSGSLFGGSTLRLLLLASVGSVRSGALPLSRQRDIIFGHNRDVEVPTFNKVEIPVFTMLVPGSIASIHS